MENKTAISYYLKVTKKSRRGYRRQIKSLCNEIGMFEIEEQHLACPIRCIFKNNRRTGIEVQQLWRERLKKMKHPQKESIQCWK